MYLTEIDPKIGKQLARHNYNTIEDLLAPETNFNEPKYLTRKQLVKCPGHNLVSEKAYQELIDKLPEETSTPTHIMDPKDPCTIYKVIEDHMQAKKKQETEEQGKDTHPS